MSSELTWEFDNTKVRTEDDIQGGDYPRPGTYHLQITDVDSGVTEETGNPYLKVGLVLLAGLCDEPDAGNQAGRHFSERFFVTEKSLKRLQKFALATGLSRPGEKGTVDFANAVGRTFVGKVIEEETKNGNKITKLAFLDFWSVNNPEVAGIPKAVTAGSVLAAPASGMANGSPPIQTPPAATTGEIWNI